LDINGLTVIGLMFNWGDRVYGQGEAESLRQEKLRVGFLRLTPDPRSLNPVFIDHDDFKWISLEQLVEFDFAPADRVFVKKLRNGEIAIHP